MKPSMFGKKVAVSTRLLSGGWRMFSRATNAFQVEHSKEKRKFFIKLGEDEAVLEYAEGPPGVLDMYHTEVPLALRGNSIGNILAEAAFEHVVAEDLRMKLSCTFLQKYLRENPNHQFTQRLV